jgi:hypothetical protein
MVTYQERQVFIVHVIQRKTRYSPAVEPPAEVEVQFVNDDGSLIQGERPRLVLVTELDETIEGEIQLNVDTADVVQG